MTKAIAMEGYTMAKPYRAKAASYYIKEVVTAQHWTLAKFPGKGGGDTDMPTDTYNLRTTSVGNAVLCDCPASFRGAKGQQKQVCKHVGWLKRWQRLREEGKLEDVVAYYDSSDDKFHKAEGLSVC